MRYLGEDEFGIWTGMPAGGIMQRGSESPVELAYGHVGLFPHEGWWTAWFNGRPRHVEIYCDIATPPVWETPDEVTMVDLDLDVVRDRETGKVRLLDEDEFAEHQRRYSYPPDVIEQATSAASWLTKALGDGTEPFNSVYKEWFAKI
jgi:protein associated with RNAse G/E